MTNLLTYFKNRHEILGMNDRNYTYEKLNRGKISIADNKLFTKRLLEKNDIAVPATFAVIRSVKELDNFDFESLPSSFVLKPAKGFKGAGINIYYNKSRKGGWLLADGRRHFAEDISSHVLNILDGQFSHGISPKPSEAVFEERIRMHKAFKYYSYRGIPDIRIIVYRGVPVMGMLRLPTKESEGKANISLGALGVGIDMARGVSTTAVKSSRSIENVPGTNIKLSGIKIPYWNKILRLSHRCQIATGLGYLGVDLIIDRDKGPLVVELNARPGLGIQQANQAGLKERLQQVRKLKNISEERAIRIAKDLFGGEIEEEVENITGREVIGLTETVFFTNKDGDSVKVDCKIDTGAESSSLDAEVLKTLGYEELVDYINDVLGAENVAEKPRIDRKKYEQMLLAHEEVIDVVRVKSALGYDYRVRIELDAKIRERNFKMHASIANRVNLKYPVIIGKRDLKEFLIDPTKG